MKNLVAIVIIFLPLLSFAQDANPGFPAFSKANEAYATGSYQEALELYLESAEKYSSAELYYNIGNTYYKLHKIPLSILYYEKALKYDPANEDILYNLAQANKLIVDKIDPKPVSKLSTWWAWFKYGRGEKTWGMVAIVLMCIAAVMFGLYFLSHRLVLRRIGFFAGFILLALCIGAYVLAMDARLFLKKPGEAIIMEAKAEVMSAPTDDATQIFVLHEGTKVKLLGSEAGWREISISNGEKGWLKPAAFAEI